MVVVAQIKSDNGRFASCTKLHMFTAMSKRKSHAFNRSFLNWGGYPVDSSCCGAADRVYEVHKRMSAYSSPSDPSLALNTGIHASMTIQAEVPCQSG
jgi:hypothetical protein